MNIDTVIAGKKVVGNESVGYEYSVLKRRGTRNTLMLKELAT